MKRSRKPLTIFAIMILAIAIASSLSAAPAQAQSVEGVFAGHRIVIPESSLPSARPSSHKLFLRRLRSALVPATIRR